LWIIARSSDDETNPAEESLGSGALMAKIEAKEVPLPLKHTDVRASVSGYIGSVEVVQQFQIPTTGDRGGLFVSAAAQRRGE
jgi:Ca-activated chloride channel family protein